MIYISQLTLKNYRRLNNVSIPLKPQCVIIGENNAGKTSILELLDIALNPTRRSFFLNEEDITHGSPPNSRIEATIEIKPVQGPIFGTAERVAFDPHVDILPNGQERLIIKLEYFPDEDDGIYRTQMRYLKSDGADDGPVKANHRRNMPLFVIPALRSAARDLISKGGTWGRMLGGVELDAVKKEEVKKLARNLADQIMQLALGNDTFTKTTSQFSSLLQSVLWAEQTDGELAFSALPSDQKEFLQAMQILIRNPGDVETIGILGHGDGTQSIAVVALMLAYASAMGYPNAAIAVEEPESHLHPHATRSLVKYLWNRQQPIIITTHSTHVTDVVSPDQVIALKRRGSSTIACQIPDNYYSPQELRQLSRYIHSAGSEFFFAKCVLLTEGKTESLALPIFAKSLKINLDQLGISIIDVSGQNFRPFVKLFQKQALDTPYLIMCDNDDAAVSSAKILFDLGLITFKVEKSTIEANRTALEKIGLFFLPKGNFEEYVMSEGHVDAYENAISQINGVGKLDSYVKVRATSDMTYGKKTRDAQIVDFIAKEHGKPELAFEVSNFITKDGIDATKIPPYFIRVLRAVETMARHQTEIADGNIKKST